MKNGHAIALSLLSRIGSPRSDLTLPSQTEVDGLKEFMTSLSKVDRLGVWSYISKYVPVNDDGLNFMRTIHPAVKQLFLESIVDVDADTKVYIDNTIPGLRPPWTPEGHTNGEWKRSLDAWLGKYR